MPDGSLPYRPNPYRDDAHAAGRRASEDCIWRDGHEISSTGHPDQWPTWNRRAFYELGWRPWTPPGETPVWWSVVDDHEPTADPIVLAEELGLRGPYFQRLGREIGDGERVRLRAGKQ